MKATFHSFRSMASRLRAAAAAHATTPEERLLGACSAGLLTVGLILAGYSACDCLLKGYDDSYITYRYAQNLATGKGLVFNLGDATDSASSFLYTLILAFAHRMGMHDLPLVATSLGVACAAGVSACVYLACVERTQRPFLALFLGVTVSTHGLVSAWAVSGMETLFFMLLVTTTCLRLFVRNRLGWSEAALIAATMLTRFEGILLAAVWVGLLGARFAKATRSERHSLAQQLAAVSGSFAAFLAFKYSTYGTFLPHAFVLKTITRLYAPHPDALWDVWRTTASGLMLFAVAGMSSLPRRIESVALLLYCVLSILSLILGPSADWARYSVHMLPIAAMLSSLALSTLIRELPVLAIAACALLASQSYDSFMNMRAAIEHAGMHATCRRQIGAYLERSLKPGTTVLSSDIGVIAYEAPSMIFVDAVGLTSKDVLAARERGQNIDRVLLAKKPLVIADTCKGTCALPSEFSSYNWLTDRRYWRTSLPTHIYSSLMYNGQLLDRCVTQDGLTVGAAQFELRMAGTRAPPTTPPTVP